MQLKKQEISGRTNTASPDEKPPPASIETHAERRELIEELRTRTETLKENLRALASYKVCQISLLASRLIRC